MYVDKIDVVKKSVDEMSVVQMSVDEMSVDRMTRCHFIINLSINFWTDNIKPQLIKVFRLKP
jgi:hypothetical protein